MKLCIAFTFIIFLILAAIFFSSCVTGPQMPSSHTNLYSININGTNQEELAQDIGNYSFARNKIIYDFISSMNLDGTDQKQLLPPGLFSDNNVPSYPSVSEDGSKVVFFSNLVGHYSAYLYLMNSDGSNFTRINLPDTSSEKSFPRFSFDGNKIVFLNSYDIYESDINGGNFKKLINNSSKKGISFIDPSFTPENNIIYAEYNDSTSLFVSLHLLNLSNYQDTVFFTFIHSSEDYYEVSSNNSVLFVTGNDIHEVNLKDFSDKILGQGGNVHYSPDFSFITFIELDHKTIDLLNLSTNELKKIYIADKFDSIGEPMLSPDGTKIFFLSAKTSF